MAIDGRTPVIVGVGQVTIADVQAPEPIALLERAAWAAADDAGTDAILAALQSIRIVRIMSRGYPDPAALLVERIGVPSVHRGITTSGGNHPQALINRTAHEIANEGLDLALIGGAESWRTRSAAKKRGDRLDWSKQDSAAIPDDTYGDDEPFFHADEAAVGIERPGQMYAIFETALRNALGLEPEAHLRRISELWSRFSSVASRNPYAAIPRTYTPEQISTVSDENRMINYPYPKLMNSNIVVDQSAALIMCSVERARALGIDDSRWVFPWSGAEAFGTATASTRDNLAESPAIRVAGRTALALAGVEVDDVDLVDLYSCFPSAVQVAASELGLSLDRELTATGGLTFAGGPANNYTTHAIASLVPLLRTRPDDVAIATANGGMLSKHAIGVYSGTPPRTTFRRANVQAEVDEFPSRALAKGYAGTATVEAYTIEFDSARAPARVLTAALTPDGARTWHASVEPSVIEHALAGDLIGRPIATA
ncbi:hypothetical protein [Mycobacterium vicinigordonae]|uniref:Uncharacterized protein n=1 Tax=Mycobacterium vicinigordonae TaxID=1719132 RepID=A0A7D6IP85_9MYCO|nr:hypothetical protein [Mycobacterium vicinigordonae]QLL08700.1 hypothetical protein H0P51_07215 [Mycobacterium vicinigordonae]